jgi:hypothetical protein
MFKKILIGLSLLVVLLVVVVVGIFFYAMNQVNSPSFADSIKKQILDKTGLELQFSEHSISLRTLTLKNLTLPNPKAAPAENLLAVDEVKLSYDLISLFKGTLELPEISLTKPVLKLRQSKEGGLILPVDLAQLKTRLAGDQGTQTQGKAARPMPINAPNIKIIAAAALIYADDGSLLFQADHANITAGFTQTISARSAEGLLEVKQVTVVPAIKITDLKSPLKFENDILSLTDMKGTLYGGPLKATASLDTKASPMTYETKAQAASVDMSGLMTGVGSDPQTLLGKLQFDFKGAGNLDTPKEILGGGTFNISEVLIPKLQDLKILGSVLGISALKEGKLDAVESTYTIAQQKVVLQPLDIKSDNLNIAMTGPVGFDKMLDLKGNVNLDPNAVKILITMAGIKTVEGQGIPITVQGPVNDPQIQIDGQKLASVLAVLDPAKLLQSPEQLMEAGSKLLDGFLKPKSDNAAPDSNGTTAPAEKKPGGLDLFNPFKSQPKEPTPTQP